MLEFIPDIDLSFLQNANTGFYIIVTVVGFILSFIFVSMVKLFIDNTQLKEENDDLKKELVRVQGSFSFGDNLIRKQRERLKHYDDLLLTHSKLSVSAKELIDKQEKTIDELQIKINDKDELIAKLRGTINILQDKQNTDTETGEDKS